MPHREEEERRYTYIYIERESYERHQYRMDTNILYSNYCNIYYIIHIINVCYQIESKIISKSGIKLNPLWCRAKPGIFYYYCGLLNLCQAVYSFNGTAVV